MDGYCYSSSSSSSSRARRSSSHNNILYWTLQNGVGDLHSVWTFVSGSAFYFVGSDRKLSLCSRALDSRAVESGGVGGACCCHSTPGLMRWWSPRWPLYFSPPLKSHFTAQLLQFAARPTGRCNGTSPPDSHTLFQSFFLWKKQASLDLSRSILTTFRSFFFFLPPQPKTVCCVGGQHRRKQNARVDCFSR